MAKPAVETNKKPQLHPVDDNGLPEKTNPVFYYAMAVGGLVMFAGFFIGWQFDNSLVHANLIISIGSAVLLAAFGGQVKVFTGKVALAGSIAGAVVLFFIIDQAQSRRSALAIAQTEADNLKRFARGTIHGVKKGMFKNVSMQSGVDFMGNYDPVRSMFYFSFFGELEDRNVVSIYFDRQNQQDDANLEFEETGEVIIDVSCIEVAYKQQKKLLWNLVIDTTTDEDEGEVTTLVIKDFKSGKIISRKMIGEIPKCDLPIVSLEPEPDANRFARATSFGWMSAFAQTKVFSRISFIPPKNLLDRAIIELNSNDRGVRRSARELLSKASLEFLPVILGNMRNNERSYRIVLGTSVALTLMLRRNKSLAPKIAAYLNSKDREILINAAGHKDRTLRNYATEFLYDLGDPTLARLAIQKAAQTSSAKARYNLIFSSRDGWSKLRPEEKARLKPSLNTVKSVSSARTKALTEKLR